MRRRAGIWSQLMMAAMLGLGLPPAVRAADGAPVLRRWHLGLQGVSTWRSRYDVFGRTGLPSGTIDERGHGGGFVVGHRFGERFLLDGQLTAAAHDIGGSDTSVTDVELLITGTVLWRPYATLQPFLRGGFGGGGEYLTITGDAGHVFAFGTAAIAGGGCQVRLGSRVSLEWEMVATFNNFLEVTDATEGDLWPGDSWQVRVSNWGWRSGVGVMVWF